MAQAYAFGSMGELRKRRSGNYVVKSVAKKLAIPVFAVFTIMFAVFIPTGADDYNIMLTSNTASAQKAQGAAYTMFLTAEQGLDDTKREALENAHWWVEVPGNDTLTLVLSCYNYFAYHLDDAVANSASVELEEGLHTDPNFGGVDKRLLAVGMIGNYQNEIGKGKANIDIVETGGSERTNADWNALDYEGKYAALTDPLWCVDRWSTDYSYYDNALEGKWGYGLIQFTGGRRVNFANWAYKQNLEFSDLSVQLNFIVVEWCQTLHSGGTINYIISELTGKSAENLADAKRAVQLLYGCTTYHGGGVTIPAGGRCSHCGDEDHTGRNSNLDLSNFAGTGMTLYEVLMTWDADPTAFGAIVGAPSGG